MRKMSDKSQLMDILQNVCLVPYCQSNLKQEKSGKLSQPRGANTMW